LNLATALTLSGLLAGFYALLQMSEKFILSFDFSKTNSFNTVGSVNSLEIFLGSLLLMAAVLFVEAKASLWRKVFFGLSALFFLFMILSINFSNVWFILLIGSIVVVALGLINREQVSQFRLVLPMVILVFSVLMIFIRFNVFNVLNVPAEVFPSFGASMEIDKSALKADPFLGAGQGNYAYVYGKYRSLDLNQTNFWNIRFSQSFSKILTQPATLGLLGSLFWLLTLLGFLIYGFLKLIKNKGENWTLALAVFSAWLVLALGQFFYSSNLTLELAFWLTMGLSFLILRNLDENAEEKMIAVEFGHTSPLASILSFSFVVVLVLSISALYLGGNYYYADILYQKGLKAANVNDLETSYGLISKTVQLNPFNDLYLRSLAQNAILRVNLEFQKPQSSERDSRIRNLTAAAIDIAKQATDFGPLEVENWVQRGSNYRAVMAYTSGADQWAIDSYKKAVQLEPNNPFYYMELGRSYLAAAELIGSDENKKTQKAEYVKAAEEAFNKSISLKSDYAPSLFQQAMLFDSQNRSAEAIAKMEQTKSLSAEDTGVAFQLGLLYYKDNNFKSAQAEFERAITLDKNYSNARYFLGLIFDRQGDKGKALEQFLKIAELNPDNAEVKTIIENLRAGKSALVSSQPEELPVQEKQPETAR